MKIDPNEIGSSSWIFQEIKYLSDLSNEKLDNFFLAITESLEWINEYMEDVVNFCESAFCDNFKMLSPASAQQLLTYEKDSCDTASQTYSIQKPILFKNIGFAVVSSPLKNFKEDESTNISENIDIDYEDDILRESCNDDFSMMETNNEQNINLKYDSSSRVMEMITEEDEVDVDEEILDIVEMKESPKSNKLEIMHSSISKDHSIASSEKKHLQSNSSHSFCFSEDSLMAADIEESIESKKDITNASKYKNVISPIQNLNLSCHLDSQNVSSFGVHSGSTSIVHSHFSPPTNSVNMTSFASPVVMSSLNFVSLPPREPLNTKKSLGKRISQHGSFCETTKIQKTLDSKLLGILKNEKQGDNCILENKSLEVLQKQNYVFDGILEKKSTFNEIDPLNAGEQRLKTVFTNGSQRIHEALNSLRTAKPVSEHFKPVFTEQKLQTDVGIKLKELDENSMSLNKKNNTVDNVIIGLDLGETVSSKNEEYFTSKIDVNNSIDISIEQKEQLSSFNSGDNKSNTESTDEKQIVLNKSDDTFRHRTSIINMPTISVIGAIQAARNSAAQVIRKATSVFFSPSLKKISRESLGKFSADSLESLDNLHDENVCPETIIGLECETDSEKNNEVSKNTIYKTNIESNNIIETMHNSIKIPDYRKEGSIDEIQFLVKKSSSNLSDSISHETNAVNKVGSQGFSCKILKKISPSQQAKLNNLNPTPVIKNKPVSIKVTTASQRQVDLMEKRKMQKTNLRTSSKQDLNTHFSQNQENCSTKDPVQYNISHSQEPSILAQSRPQKRLIVSKGIKALTAATIARKKEQEEKDRKLAHKKEIERKRQENLKKQEESKKQEQWHREDTQRKLQHEKINDIKKKPILETNEHSSSMTKKTPIKSSEKNTRGPLEDIINNDGKNRETLNAENKPFKRVLQDELVQENWGTFSTSNKPAFQEAKKRKTDEHSQKTATTSSNHIPAAKNNSKDSRFSRTQAKEKGLHFHLQVIPQKQTKSLQNRYPGNQQPFPLKTTKNTGPMVDSVKFSSDNIRFGGDSSKPCSTQQFPPPESIELPEIDSE
ncbi:uncharacterized protein T551_01055 [Pneumocystis jirovecii RU7]|uniref:Inner centromere protein ARK-binding domain-containing protein n=1 Tax=Pneumocystis jirovecii (strain RU7) TaxID=1408657 RepID=A0A0W4ZTS8_PNEJ7|nr:uncharacterized protein T551_01055 [Pneumocystis jirovecii RU7]KTW31794.1 hypothetical protein T551_01055 [Pneumocystis jirovecii RU7]